MHAKKYPQHVRMQAQAPQHTDIRDKDARQALLPQPRRASGTQSALYRRVLDDQLPEEVLGTVRHVLPLRLVEVELGTASTGLDLAVTKR